MVKFFVSKIQSSSWYSGNSDTGEIMSAIYSEIHSNGKYIDSKTKFCLRTIISRGARGFRLMVFFYSFQYLKREEGVVQETSVWFILSKMKTIMDSIFLPFSKPSMDFVWLSVPVESSLDIFVFKCDRIYDPANMDDAYGDDRQSRANRAPKAIVGTIGVGLGKAIKEGSAKDVHPFQTLVPAKIMLISTLNEALEHMQKKPVESTDGTNQDGHD